MIKFSGTTYLSVLTLPFHHRSIRRRKLEICSYFALFLLFSPHIWVKSILGSKSTSWSICFRKMFCGDEPITVESLSSGHFFPLWRYSFSHVDFRREAVTRFLVCLRSLQSGQRERVWVDCPPLLCQRELSLFSVNKTVAPGCLQLSCRMHFSQTIPGFGNSGHFAKPMPSLKTSQCIPFFVVFPAFLAVSNRRV